MGHMMGSASTRGLPPRLILPQLNDHLYHSGARPGKADRSRPALKLQQVDKGAVRFTGLHFSDRGRWHAGRDELVQELGGHVRCDAE